MLDEHLFGISLPRIRNHFENVETGLNVAHPKGQQSFVVQGPLSVAFHRSTQHVKQRDIRPLYV